MTGRPGASGATGAARPTRSTQSGTRVGRVFTRATSARLTKPCATLRNSGWPGDSHYPAKTLVAVGRAHRVLCPPYGGHSMSAPTGVVCVGEVHDEPPKKTTNRGSGGSVEDARPCTHGENSPCEIGWPL